MAFANAKSLGQTPKEVVSVRMVLYAVILSFSGCLHGFNTANITGVLAMKPFIKHFEFSKFTATEKNNFVGWVTSTLLLGSCVGALICAPVTERWGRRISLAFFSFIFAISAILMTANPGGKAGQGELLAGRFLSGLGSGAASVIGTGYMAEIAPKAIRGGLSALYNANTMLGVGLAYWINYGCLLHISSNSNIQWRLPMAIQALPGVILMVLLPFVPESPRWLVSLNRRQVAQASLEKLRQIPVTHEYFQKEFNEILAFHEQQSNHKSNIRQFTARMGTSPFRRRFFMVALIQVFFQFSGGNIITYYNTSILTSIGLKSQTTNYLFSGIYGCVKVVAVLSYSIFFVDRYGRRPLVFAGSAIIIPSLIYMSAYLGISERTGSNGGAAGWLAVVSIYTFAIGYAISWATIPWIINSEAFPTDVRSISMAVIITWQYLVNFALTRALPNMTVAMHSWGPFALFACTTSVAVVFCYFALPETRGLSLEQMDQLFEGHWHAVGQRSISLGKTVSMPGDEEELRSDGEGQDCNNEDGKRGVRKCTWRNCKDQVFSHW